MKITVEGSPKELAILATVLGNAENEEKKAGLPPLLTELADTAVPDTNKEIADMLSAMNAKAAQNARENAAPQVEAAEKEVTFGHFKPRFEELLKRTNEANARLADTAISNTSEENAPQVGTAEQKVPFLVSDIGGRGHRKRIKKTSCESTVQTNDND